MAPIRWNGHLLNILYIIEILKYTLCGFTILSCFSFIELLKSIAVCPVVAEITL